MTSDTMIRSELEYRALAIAQDEIDAIRWIQARSKNGPVFPYDPFDPDNDNFIYDDNPDTRVIQYGSENQYSETFEINRTAELLEETSDQRRYLITITIRNERLSPPLNVALDFVRTLTFEY
ncbi:hypothetical protein [Gracilimonas halophila]|uniref:Uncharacterized protein n=1 Tax=Gracilimonas halophila TaxID=1834464 RepID=A0ABW5JLK2_9BACT